MWGGYSFSNVKRGISFLILSLYNRGCAIYEFIITFILKQIGCTCKENQTLSLDAMAMVKSVLDDETNSHDIFDMHTHVVGVGHHGTGCCSHPNSYSFLRHPFISIQRVIFTNVSGISNQSETIDQDYIKKLIQYTEHFNTLLSGKKYKHFLLAMTYWYDRDGTIRPDKTGLYVPNDYVLSLSNGRPDLFNPCVSVSPYQTDCVKQLELYASQGVKMVKWLPNSMGIKMTDPECQPFYNAMRRLNLVLLCHVGEENAVSAGGPDQSLGNPLLLRAPLDSGVKVIAAHCASEGENIDLDSSDRAKKESNFRLFLRLMDDPKYNDVLFADISSLILYKRIGEPLTTMLDRTDLHHRLVYGSDYPVPIIGLLVHTRALMYAGYINNQQRALLNEIFDFNPLLFDYITKRIIKSPNTGNTFHPSIFGWNKYLLG